MDSESNSQTETKLIGKGNESGRERSDLIEKPEIFQKERSASFKDLENIESPEKSFH